MPQFRGAEHQKLIELKACETFSTHYYSAELGRTVSTFTFKNYKTKRLFLLLHPTTVLKEGFPKYAKIVRSVWELLYTLHSSLCIYSEHDELLCLYPRGDSHRSGKHVRLSVLYACIELRVHRNRLTWWLRVL